MGNKSPAKKGWPADKVERRAIDALIPYARNARTHSDEQVAQIAASMREWGWTNPVLVDEDGGIIAGHGRIMAARQLGIDEVPCMVANGWTEAQKRAYVIADNKLALNARWDDFELKAEMEELSSLDFDLGVTGFSEEEIESILEDGPKLRKRSENLEPIRMGRMLISFPTDKASEVEESISKLIELGFVEVDYGGN